jgi:hypothetical protein
MAVQCPHIRGAVCRDSGPISPPAWADALVPRRLRAPDLTPSTRQESKVRNTRLYYTSKQTGGETNPETHWGKPGTPRPEKHCPVPGLSPRPPFLPPPTNNDTPRRANNRGKRKGPPDHRPDGRGKCKDHKPRRTHNVERQAAPPGTRVHRRQQRALSTRECPTGTAAAADHPGRRALARLRSGNSRFRSLPGRDSRQYPRRLSAWAAMRGAGSGQPLTAFTRRVQSAAVTRMTGPVPCWVVSRTRTAPAAFPASTQFAPFPL